MMHGQVGLLAGSVRGNGAGHQSTGAVDDSTGDVMHAVMSSATSTDCCSASTTSKHHPPISSGCESTASVVCRTSLGDGEMVDVEGGDEQVQGPFACWSDQ